MTYKQIKKIQIYILILLIILILFNNFQLIFKTRNITETGQNFLSSVFFIEKLSKNETNTKKTFQKGLFKPSLSLEYTLEVKYIKEKLIKSLSGQSILIDKRKFLAKGLIDSYFNLINKILVSVKDRYLLGQSMIESKREYFLESLEGMVGARSAPLAKGLLFGDVSGISQDTYHSFKVIGILHILSASSANFTIFLHFALLFFRPFLPFLSKRQLFFLYFSLIGLYFCLVGAAPSTTRAFLTLSFGFFASFVLLRSNLSLNHLYLVGIFISFINPFYLQTLGFQFSFLASFGILFLYDYLEKEPFIAKNYLYKSLLLTFCAQFFLLPIMVFNFAEFNYLAFLANLLILPLVELLTIMFLASFMALFFNEVFNLEFLQLFISILISKTIDILFLLIEYLEKIPWKNFIFIENKNQYTKLFFLINLVGILAINFLKKQKYSKKQYRIFK